MSITIQLTPEEETKLLKRASRAGQDVTTYVRMLIERDIADVDEALAPLRRQVEGSGMSDDDLHAFFQEVREEAWQEKHGKASNAS